MKHILTCFSFFLIFGMHSQTPRLKAVIYDFDGLDIGAANLPDGDYKNFDMDYHISANPLGTSDMLGDRVLRLDLNWSSGTGEFGKGITHYIELNPATDRFNFYFLNPLSNYADAIADVVIKEDDNQNDIYESSFDDKWISTITVPRSPNWQLVSLPLSSFTDANSGGNGIFDAGYVSNHGKILTLGLTFHRSAAASGPETYYADMLCFSEGAMPVGGSILDLPPAGAYDHCDLGSYAYRSPADSVPPEVESMFPPGNKLKYINIFMPFAYTGTTASVLPSPSVQRLMDNGYRPMITWEMMYAAYPALDPVQPRLNKITNGYFDTYIDAFANQVKTYSDTLIIRLFHEFNGNWYSWSVEENGQDPNNLINAFRYVVNRFNALGANNVLWMWSPNPSPVPDTPYNWFVNAYPGNAFVDIVATSIYNHPIAGTPPWRSFRSLLAESYYYAKKYFPSKPFMIAESGVRERDASEDPASQTKAEWICDESHELQSFFCKTKALIFLNVIKEHDWRINSSFAAKEAVRTCMWQDPYFSILSTNIAVQKNQDGFSVFPNPFNDAFSVSWNGDFSVSVYDASGKKLEEKNAEEVIAMGKGLVRGMYIVEVNGKKFTKRMRVIKQ